MELTKLKSESDFLDNTFWQHFRILCYARWGTKSLKWHIFTFFCGINYLMQGAVTKNSFHSTSFHAWYLLWAGPLRGSRFCQIPTQEIVAHKQIKILHLQSRYFLWPLHQSRLSSKGLFTWRWGTPYRWGNLLRWGNPPVHTISHINLIAFT